MKKNKDKLFKFGKATEKELLNFQMLIKESITSFNNLEDLESLIDGKFSKENKFALNSTSYLNQIKVKIIIDFIEILKISIIIANGISEDFIKFQKLVSHICKNFLMNREKTFRDSAIFVNLVILNFPFFISHFSKSEFFDLQKTDEIKGKIIGFNFASVLGVKNPIYRLWSKKCFYTCKCNIEKKFTVKYTNIYKPDNYNNSNFYEIACKECKKPFYTDKNSELFIEAQEISLLLPTEVDSLLNNKISLWLYGDMINSVKEGEKISFLSYYTKPKSNNFHQKDYSFGNFVALNINIYFEETKYLRKIYLNFNLINKGKDIKINNHIQKKNLHNKHLKISHIGREPSEHNNQNLMKYINDKAQNFISQDKLNENKNLNEEKNYIINNKYNFNEKFNQNSEINILRSIGFGKQISSAYFNFIYVMYLGYLEKSLLTKIKNDANKENYLNSTINDFSIFDINDINYKNYNENIFIIGNNNKNNKPEYNINTKTKFNFYLHLACKLSIIQREYFTKLKQYFYLHNCQHSLEDYNRKNKTFLNNNNDNKINNESNKSSINDSNILSRSVIFKTKIFGENKQKEKINEDYKKYFKFARQGLNEYNNSCDLLMKPLNLLLIYDEISIENLSEIYSLVKNFNLGQVENNSNCNIYQDLIITYPYFIPNKLQKESIIMFLKSNNNKIILIPDIDILSKFEIEIISSILINNCNTENDFNSNITMEYNITFWFICSYRKLCLKEKKNNSSDG